MTLLHFSIQHAVSIKTNRPVWLLLSLLSVLLLTSCGGQNVLPPRPAPKPQLTLTTLFTSQNMLGEITKGPDGALWFVEPFSHKIGRITPAGKITEFALPPTNVAGAITTGPDGALWFTERVESANNTTDKIGRITPSGKITEFALPLPDLDSGAITAGPDGALWFVEPFSDKIGRITPSGQITGFALPGKENRSDDIDVGLDITAGPDGALWFTENRASKIGRITLQGEVTEFALPRSEEGIGSSGRITTGPDGALWFTERVYSVNSTIDKIGRITPSGQITEFALPRPRGFPTAVLYGITTGPDGALWFTENQANKIGRITPSGQITEFALPDAERDGGYPFLSVITTGPDGALWFTERTSSGSSYIKSFRPPSSG